MMKKILLADSQSIFCLGIKQILNNNKGFCIVDVAMNAEELENKILSQNPDILFIDFETVADFKSENLQLFKSQYPEIKIIIISAQRNKEIISGILKYGINHFLTKDCDAEDIVDALESAVANEKYYSPYILDILVSKK